MGESYKLSKNTIRHIWDKHRDLVEMLEARSPTELEEAIMRVLERPDEVYGNKYRDNVKYYLRKLNNHWVNIVLIGDTVKTAYLIGLKSYMKFRERKWCQRF